MPVMRYTYKKGKRVNLGEAIFDKDTIFNVEITDPADEQKNIYNKLEQERYRVWLSLQHPEIKTEYTDDLMIGNSCENFELLQEIEDAKPKHINI